MTSSDFKQYLEKRYRNQLGWYSHKASVNKRCYHRYQVSIALLAAITTITIALGMYDGDSIAWRVVSLSASAAVAALTALQRVFRFHENWIEYRTTAEDLKKEQYYHSFRCGDYAVTQAPDQLFIERVEAVISQQNTRWNVTALSAPGDGGGREESIATQVVSDS